VPGITSALAAPAAAGIPVTARGIGRSFAVVTGQRADGEGISPEEVAAFARVDTLVILMGRATLGALARQLIAAGRDAATPAACIASATLPGQRVVQATLGTIAGAADAAGLEAPVVTVIGAVAALADVRPVVAQATLAQVVGA
jgi:siroheme synthase